MLQLNLIRHAKTEPQSKSGRDFDRELLPKGRKQAELLAAFLQENGIQLGNVFCSTAARTKETAAFITETTACHIDFFDELYLASCSELKQFIAQQNGKTITIIGHNEGISELASMLCGELCILQTAGFIQLQFELEDWALISQETGIVTTRFRPEVLL
jgi:phosphohistidine phosphatase